MDKSTTERVRHRVMHALNPTTAQYAGGGMSVERLQQFVAGVEQLDTDQTHNLMRYFNIREEAR